MIKKNKRITEFIKAMSGEECWEAVAAGYAEATISIVKRQWAGLWLAAISIGKFSLTDEDSDEPFEVLVVRTPRAYPYSFKVGARHYVVLDEHLDRVTHRWARFCEMSESQPVDLAPHFDELYAERFYLIGNLRLSSICMASSYLRMNDGGDLPSLDSHDAEARFRSRSLGGRYFIIGHELGHILLNVIPPEVVSLLQEKLLELCRAGIGEEDEGGPPQDSSSEAALMERMRESPLLMRECLCDALSLASLVNMGIPWTTALISSADALRLLEVIAICDTRCRIFTFETSARSDRSKSDNSAQSAEELDKFRLIMKDFAVRKAVLVCASNMILEFLEHWGIFAMAEQLGRHAHDRDRTGHQLEQDFARFTPGVTYARRVTEPSFRPTKLDRDVDAAFTDIAKAREFIGFGDPVTIPETPWAKARIRDLRELDDFINKYRDPFAR